MKFKTYVQEMRVKPDTKVILSKIDPGDSGGMKTKAEISSPLEKNLEEMAELQYKLYAENKRSILVVFQAMDAGGKDGCIRHVMSGLNPQGCHVTSFKAPSKEELEHDYLWRIHKAVPAKGDIGIFNRSHYEDVLVVRVHSLVPRSVWSKRYEQINEFEKHLADTGTVILKFFLYISKNEQRKRFVKRIENPLKNWKFSMGDVEERKYWNNYMKAFEVVLSKCSTKYAPWYIIPSNRKWFRNYAVSQIILDRMKSMRIQIPQPKEDLSNIVIE